MVPYNVLHGRTSCHTASSHISNLLSPNPSPPTCSSPGDSLIWLPLISIITLLVEVLLWSFGSPGVYTKMFNCKYRPFCRCSSSYWCLGHPTWRVQFKGNICILRKVCWVYFRRPTSCFFCWWDESQLGPTRSHREGHEILSIPGRKQKQHRQQETVQTTGNRQPETDKTLISLLNKPQWRSAGWAIVSVIKLSPSRHTLRYDRVLVKFLRVTLLHGLILVSGRLVQI